MLIDVYPLSYAHRYEQNVKELNQNIGTNLVVSAPTIPYNNESKACWTVALY